MSTHLHPPSEGSALRQKSWEAPAHRGATVCFIDFGVTYRYLGFVKQSGSAAVSKERILAEIRRTAEENSGVALGKGRFAKETGIQEWDWAGRYWTRWGDAVREAGYEPNQLKRRLPDETLLEQLMLLTRELGHFPTANELKMRARRGDGFPSPKVFSRWGSKRARAHRLVTYCREHPDCDDVLSILATVTDAADSTEDAEPGAQPSAWGEVYLMKSGRYYKLGRSISAGRRERELQLQLPERATRIHVIQTDDPIGIERYWHERFADRRKNGEWFELTRDDVSAFKRRKFM